MGNGREDRPPHPRPAGHGTLLVESSPETLFAPVESRPETLPLTFLIGWLSQVKWFVNTGVAFNRSVFEAIEASDFESFRYLPPDPFRLLLMRARL